MKRDVFILASIILFISGCAVSYIKKGTGAFMGGYDDRQISPNQYAITAEGNAYNSYETLEEYFHRRASELCNGRNYTFDLKRTTTKHTEYYYTGMTAGTIPYNFPVVVGEIKCEEQ